MRAVSERFLAALRGSHAIAARATVTEVYQTGVGPVGTRLAVIEGAVTFDSTADCATLDLLVKGYFEDGTEVWPEDVADLVTPYGNEIYVERGINLGDHIEWVGLGYFRIQSIERDNPLNGDIRIAGMDRMQGIIGSRLLTPRQYLPGQSFRSVVADLVEDVYPGILVEWDDDDVADTAIGRQVVTTDDRRAAINDVVTSRGKLVDFDHRGALVIRGVPDPTQWVWDVDSGDAGQPGVLVSVSEGLTREGIYNAVVATGQSTDGLEGSDVPTATAYDNDPFSPTYFFGKFGQEPKFFDSPLLTTTDECEAAAISILAKSTGAPYTMDLTHVPNPALQLYDTVRVRYSRRKPTRLHVLKKLVVPLAAKAAMTASTREQTTFTVGTS